ncbi:hypothetical protein GMI70_00745 [Eggerthellaceae bacterium zg-893]|nr:hypothetical protein [Eggerthellaceae bacterium zg-893]
MKKSTVLICAAITVLSFAPFLCGCTTSGAANEAPKASAAPAAPVEQGPVAAPASVAVLPLADLLRVA